MRGPDPGWARALLDFWFEELEPDDWFGGGEALDHSIRLRFEPLLAAQSGRPAEDFLSEGETARAAILLFDQIPRNIYRDTPRAYGWDATAVEICHGFIAQIPLEGYSENECQFILMPLMHSEDLADQQLGVELFGRHAPGGLSYARSHRDIIARFGRFPHRNEVLGRASTSAEKRAVAEGASW